MLEFVLTLNSVTFQQFSRTVAAAMLWLCNVHVSVLRGLEFLSAPASHPKILNPSRTRRNLKNLARSRPADF